MLLDMDSHSSTLTLIKTQGLQRLNKARKFTLNMIIEKLNEISQENKQIRFSMNDTANKLNAFEDFIGKMEKENNIIFDC